MFTFRAMNTVVTVTAPHAHAEMVARQVAATFAEAERRFSRFRFDSELSRLNRARGPVSVSPELFAVLWRAREHVEHTGGMFDPAIGATLAALGYDRSFAPGALDRDAASAPLHPARFHDVALDPATRTVVRPEHVQLDLGGMIKGATVDAAAAHLHGDGAIDAGGDAILRGRGPDGDAWLVEIEDPRDASRTLAVVAVTDGAVATSAANRRRWRVGRALAHHLIDPRTRAPAATDLLQATVLAPRAELADVLAKTAFLLGEGGARALLTQHPEAGAVLVRHDGRVVVVGAVDVREVARA